MGTLEIIKRNGEKIRLFSKEPFCTLKSAAQNSSLMGDDNVQLSIVSSELLNLGKGDKIIVEGEEYTIRTKVNRDASPLDLQSVPLPDTLRQCGMLYALKAIPPAKSNRNGRYNTP